MRIQYAKSADLAREIANLWRDRGRVAYARPYNRWRWDESETWWVIPAPDKIAFRYSKVIMSSAPRLCGPGMIFTGLYVEKGIGPALAGIKYYSDEWVINSQWSWHGIMRDLKDGVLGPAIGQASLGIGEPVEVRVDAHVPVPKAAMKPPLDILAFETTDGVALTQAQKPSLPTGERFLKRAAAARSLSGLVEALEAIPAGDTAWVNLYIGKSFQTAGLSGEPALSARQISDRLLEPFVRWLE